MQKMIEPVLAEKGQTSWTIVLGQDCQAAEQHAAAELAGFLKVCTGADFPIRTDNLPVQPPVIVLGKSSLLPEIDVATQERIGPEGYLFSASDGQIIIAGQTGRGTLNGVYSFLEKYLACRWFTPEVSRLPRHSRLAIPFARQEVRPQLLYRDIGMYAAQDASWSARNRLNGHSHRRSNKQGGHVTFAGPHSHSFQQIAAPAEYFASHPEYFSMVDGVRISENTQLCLTNPAVLDLAVAKAKDWLAARPAASVVSIAPNDCYNPCQCPSCRQVDEYEGSHSGSLINFVNAVAEKLAPDHPQVLVSTLAYRYTRKPPRHVRPHPQVLIYLCSIESCNSHPFSTCHVRVWPHQANNLSDQSFADDLLAWSQIASQIHVWTYVSNFAHYLPPFPNWPVLAPNIRFLAEQGVSGIFTQGNYQTPGGYLDQLKAYVLARLLWDPQLETDQLVSEFCQTFYGQAGSLMADYIYLLQEASQKSGVHLGLYDSPAWHSYLTLELLEAAGALLDQAEQAVQTDPAALRRVSQARLALNYALVCLLPSGSQAYQEQLADLLAGLSEFGVLFVSEFLDSDRARKLFAQGLDPDQIMELRLAELKLENITD